MIQEDITTLLLQMNDGEEEAWEKLIRLTYKKLCEMASAQRKKFDTSETLNTFSLVHEAFLSLYHNQQIEWVDRTHFFMTIAKSFKYVLSNSVRNNNRLKRGKQFEHIELDEETIWIDPNATLITALDEALNVLESQHPRAHRIVMLRFFLGVQEKEIAELLNISTRTVMRDFKIAKIFLAKEILN